MPELVLSLDAGTTGITALVVDPSADVRARSTSEFTQSYPQPGWVEHDPEEIWTVARAVMSKALDAAGMTAADLAAVGITNQRETVVLWDRATGDPVAPAIVWQDRRTASLCDRLRAEGHEDDVRTRTGLVLDPYFSGTKLTWLLENIAGARARAEAGELAFGTIDTWLLWKLSGGTVHVTEPSNASRTLLYSLAKGTWDPAMLELLDIPPSVLPSIQPSSGRFTETTILGKAPVPIAGVAGDQQAALFGQVCVAEGMAKNTYGTGSFVLMNTGRSARTSTHGLLTSAAWDLGHGLGYVLEGSIFITGAAVQWLRDGLGIISAASEAEPLASSVADAGGTYLVPAFVGLGAPHWDPYARGAYIGITRGTTRAHLARAAVEAMAYQTRDVVEAMVSDAGRPLGELRVDGGASTMDLLCQIQADQLGVVVRRPANLETTALGAAFLAGLAEGVWSSAAELTWRVAAEFEPAPDRARADESYEGWKKAVERARDWARP